MQLDPETRTYNIENIRSLLDEGFNDEDLRCLCYDAPEFVPVYDQLGPNTNKAKVIGQLIEYASQKSQMEIILTLARKRKSAIYEKHQPYYEDTAMALRGLSGTETILVPANAKPLLTEINNVANERQKRTLVKDIGKIMTSIEHKLNIVRYNAGLIKDLNEDDYLRFRHHHLFPDTDSLPANVSYKDRCLFTVTDIKEYRLFFTFFVETFAAAAFSLFDVCAYLLKELYDLQFKSDKGKRLKVNFMNALAELNLQNRTIYSFLRAYKPEEPNSVDWIQPLKKIRNETTHSVITDICRLPRDSGNLYDPPQPQQFLIYEKFFPSQTDETKLKEFVEECFDGLESFVEELYDKLYQEVNSTRALPL